MILKVKLYASLKPYLPAGAVRNEADMEIGEDVAVQTVLDQFNIPEELCKLVMVNGVFIHPEERPSRIFVAGDVLAVWPPVAGG